MLCHFFYSSSASAPWLSPSSSIHFSPQQSSRSSGFPVSTTWSEPTSPPSSWRSWRRSSTSTNTWRGRAGWRSPPVWSWTRRRWKSGFRTAGWSRRNARNWAAFWRRHLWRNSAALTPLQRRRGKTVNRDVTSLKEGLSCSPLPPPSRTIP